MSELRSDTRVNVTVGDLEIEATERIVVWVERVCDGIVGLASKQPVSIVVRSPAGTWRLDLQSEHRLVTIAGLTTDAHQAVLVVDEVGLLLDRLAAGGDAGRRSWRATAGHRRRAEHPITAPGAHTRLEVFI